MTLKSLTHLLVIVVLLVGLKLSYSQSITPFDKHIDSLISTSRSYYGKSLDSSMLIADKIIKESKLKKSETNITKGLRQKGIILVMKRQFKHGDSILMANFNRPIDSITLGLNYQCLANSYEYQSKYDLAIENYLKAMIIYEKLNCPLKLYRVSISVATVNARIKRFDYAITYLEKAITHADANNFPKSEAMANLSGIYYMSKKDYKKFIKISHETIKQAKKEKLYPVLGYVYTNLCELYNDVDSLKNPDKALKYGKLALQRRKSSGSESNLSYTYLQLSKAYYNLGDLPKSISYSNMAYPIANNETKPIALSLLIDSYKKIGNYKLALKLSQRQVKLNDSINKTLQEQKVTEIVENYNSEKKQQQIDKLRVNKQLREAQITNQYYLFVVFIGLLIILATILYYRYRNQKITQKLNNQSLKHKLLQTQLNPHFIFHSLNAIQSYIFMNKKEEATTYLASYSKLMRSILESSDTDFITVSEDFDSIKAFLKLQQLNAAEDAVLETTTQENLGDYKIPPMFTQPFVENAIIHGINDLEKGKVFVSYSENESDVIVTISDNGSGFKKNNSNTKMHRSMSSKILNERIALFKTRHNYEIKTNIVSNSNGTTVTICFPKTK